MKQPIEPVLELQDVSFRYPDGSIGLDGCSISIQRGKRVALLGANGSGKTTLFLHLNGILRPQNGTVLHQGTPLDYSRQGLHNLRSGVGLVFQNPDSQLFSASVREDVSFGPLNLGLDNKTVRSRVEEALLAVGMTECADKPVHNLSYGQKKRVCIAGALAMRPDVLILDEPMAGLDVAMQTELTHILDTLHAEGMTVIIASHDMDYAYQWADVIAIMDKGECTVSWETEELPQVLEKLLQFGVGIPRVAEMHRALTTCGLLEPSMPPVRSHSALLANIVELTVIRHLP